MDATTSHTAPTKETLETENQRMRARIKELESKLAERGEGDSTSPRRSRGSRTRPVSPETEERLRSIPGHARDEIDRLARGLSYAAAEHLRATSDVINSFADEFFARNAETRTHKSSKRPAPGTARETDQDEESHVQRAADNVSRMTDDVLAGVSRGVHESIETPRRVIERFFDAYETDSASAEDLSRRRAQASAGQQKVTH